MKNFILIEPTVDIRIRGCQNSHIRIRPITSVPSLEQTPPSTCDDVQYNVGFISMVFHV